MCMWGIRKEITIQGSKCAGVSNLRLLWGTDSGSSWLNFYVAWINFSAGNEARPDAQYILVEILLRLSGILI